MISVLVSRHPGDKPGPAISEALLSSDLVAVQRGTTEIDSNCSNRDILRGNCPLLPHIATGSLVQITEAETVTRGKITFYSASFEISEKGDYTASSSLTIEREA